MINAKLDWFIISDLHMDHANIIAYCRRNFLRMPNEEYTLLPESLQKAHLKSAHHYMVEHIIQEWNRVVGPKDKILIVGDFCMDTSKIPHYIERMNGRKYLIVGNHDDIDDIEVHQDEKNYDTLYWKHFIGVDAIGQVKVKDAKGNSDRIVITHIPIHPQCLERWRFNIHGHTHTHSINNFNPWEAQFPNQGSQDARYINVSCEQLNYTPVRIGDLLNYDDTE